MALIKVFVTTGFSTMDFGSYGPGETDMDIKIAKKYPMFVTILEEEEAEEEEEEVTNKPEIKEYKEEEAIPKITPKRRKKTSKTIVRKK